MKKLFVKIGMMTVVGITLLTTSCKEDPTITEDPSCVTGETSTEVSTCNQEDVTVVAVNACPDGVGTQTWTKDKVYLLNGFVFVNTGQTLTIEPGTIIKGSAGNGANASALIVAQGARLIANGTAAEPIIFTSQADNIRRDVNGVLCEPKNLNSSNQGLWGGVIMLGNAGLNTVPSIQQIEGIPTSESRGKYGGTDDEDNSGSLKYISIRHGGTNIGSDNEINGLTLGGVGSLTTIEHIEVIANQDDGIEFFGGTVNIKWAVVSNCGDDSFDYDQGWRGKGQFWYTQQDQANNTNGDRAGEHDGGTNPEDGIPYATPHIRNATYHGHGGGRAVTFRDNAGGKYINSIFMNFDKGIDVEDLATGEDSKARLDDGDLKLEYNVFFDIAAGTSTSDILKSSDGTSIDSHVNVNNNTVADPGITATNPIPANALGTGSTTTDNWYDNATFKGAFGTTNWATGWTMLFPAL
jgi:hypothetical protein